MDAYVKQFLIPFAGGFRVKNKSKKIKYKAVTAGSYKQLLSTYVLVKTKKESVKQILTDPFRRSDNNYYKKQLAELPLDKLTKKDIEIWHSRMESIPTAANRALAALSVVFEWDAAMVLQIEIILLMKKKKLLTCSLQQTTAYIGACRWMMDLRLKKIIIIIGVILIRSLNL